MTVVIDAGHGGIDGNGNYTTAPNKMHVFAKNLIAYEGVYNRLIAIELERYLEKKGFKTVRAYHNFIDTSLRSRAQIANTYKDAVFVSIHHNASPNHQGRGFEVWTTKTKNNSDVLANKIFHEVFKAFEGQMRFRTDRTDGDVDFEANFQVLRQSKHPSVLVECAFFDNIKDFELMRDPIWQDKMAAAIGEGIINFINGK